MNSNQNAEHRPDEQFPDWTAKLPELTEYPDNTDGWRALPIKLAGRALTFHSKVAASQSIINSVVEYTEEHLEEEYAEQAAERGLEAWNLAVLLRRTYGLEEVDVVWSYEASLEQHLKRAKKEIQKRIDWTAAYHAQLDARHPPPRETEGEETT